MDKNKIITAAVGIAPWLGPEGNPLKNVSDYAQVMDYICGLYYSPSFRAVVFNPRLRQLFLAIMNYDIYGSWSDSGGPNAPLNHSCAPGQPAFSAEAAITNWTTAGFKPSQVRWYSVFFTNGAALVQFLTTRLLLALQPTDTAFL